MFQAVVSLVKAFSDLIGEQEALDVVCERLASGSMAILRGPTIFLRQTPSWRC